MADIPKPPNKKEWIEFVRLEFDIKTCLRCKWPFNDRYVCATCGYDQTPPPNRDKL